jgi:hypothetical protein
MAGKGVEPGGRQNSDTREQSIVSSPSFDTNEDETPRHSMELDRVISWIPPASPIGNKKTRSRAGHFLPRNDSLRESKVWKIIILNSVCLLHLHIG